MSAVPNALAANDTPSLTWPTILVPVRGGPDALARVDLALRIAAGIGCGVTALYVLDERLVADPDAALVREQLQEQLAQEGRAVLEQVARLASGYALPFETMTERGPVVETILKVANRIQAGAIVVGSHKQTWLGRLLGSSVAEAVLRNATCTVIAVPPMAGFAPQRGTPPRK